MSFPTPQGATKPKRPCRFPDCSRLTGGKYPYCKEHEKERPSRKASNNKKTDPFYQSRRWRNTSLTYRKHHPLCKKCEGKGLVTPAECVDHKTPISEGGAKFDWDNLQSLCWPCHNRKTRKETAGKS